MKEETFVLLDVLRRISNELGAVAAVALAWVRQQPEVTSTIIGARSIEQLDSNLASLDMMMATNPKRPRAPTPDSIQIRPRHHQQAGTNPRRQRATGRKHPGRDERLPRCRPARRATRTTGPGHVVAVGTSTAAVAGTLAEAVDRINIRVEA